MLIPIVVQQFYVFHQNVFHQNVWFLSETLSYAAMISLYSWQLRLVTFASVYASASKMVRLI